MRFKETGLKTKIGVEQAVEPESKAAELWEKGTNMRRLHINTAADEHSGVETEPHGAHAEQREDADAQLEKLIWGPCSTQDDQQGQYHGKWVLPEGKRQYRGGIHGPAPCVRSARTAKIALPTCAPHLG